MRICDAKLRLTFQIGGRRFPRCCPARRTACICRSAAARTSNTFWPRNASLAALRRTKQPVQIADIKAEPAYLNDPQRFAIVELAGARTMVSVLMLKENDWLA